MPNDPVAQRTLVKSPPELWAEVSDEESLNRHLDEFGAVRITRLEPETTVAWEGERASGTVELEASGWGTRVTLTAVPLEPPVVEDPVAEPAARGDDPPQGWWARVRARFRRTPAAAPSPEPIASVAPEPVTPQLDPDAATAILTGVLDDLGSAHRRPFART